MAARDWKVTSQKLDTVLNADSNGFSQQWNIGYLVHTGPAAGTKGEIHVPTAELDRDTVHQAIQMLVDKHQAIAAP
jgi:hypothetical protein